MPLVSQFLYCVQAINTDGKIKIDEPLSMINIGHLPSKFSFSIVFNILGSSYDKDHTLKVLFKNPDDQVLLDTKDVKISNQNIPEAENKLSPEMQGVLVSFDFRNMDFNVEGIYKTEIIFDGDKLGEFLIPVKGSDQE